MTTNFSTSFDYYDTFINQNLKKQALTFKFIKNIQLGDQCELITKRIDAPRIAEIYAWHQNIHQNTFHEIDYVEIYDLFTCIKKTESNTILTINLYSQRHDKYIIIDVKKTDLDYYLPLNFNIYFLQSSTSYFLNQIIEYRYSNEMLQVRTLLPFEYNHLSKFPFILRDVRTQDCDMNCDIFCPIHI